MQPDKDTGLNSASHLSSRRRFLKTGALTGSALLVGGCLTRDTGGGPDSNSGERTVTDGVGREVTLPDSVDRVICVGPGTLRQVAYIQSTDRVVGVEEGEKQFLERAPYNMANPELRKLPTIGSTGPNASGSSEQIISQEPDVIFYFGDPSVAEDLSKQTDTPVVMLKIVDILGEDRRQTMYDTWRLVGTVLNRSDRASELISSMQQYVEDLQSRTSGRSESQRRSAYIAAINNKGAKGFDTTRNPFPPFQLTGTTNAAKGIDSDSPSVQVSMEKIVEWNPLTAFISTRNTGRVKQEITENPELRQVSAIANDEVYKILPYAQYHVNYGSILAISYYVGKKLYPDAYDDVSLKAKTNEVFQTFLGADLYGDLAETFSMFEPLAIPE